MWNDFDRNGSDDSRDVTSAGSTTSGAKQGRMVANGSARSLVDTQRVLDHYRRQQHFGINKRF